ncbi:MAG: preprotein translocase subunit SecA [Patescibacteria group bacterium]|nr:preprotein translocase subunit SecA [Patescibacteria group bacterium]MDD4304412.1 preprotein translocase subunit SecA [Patescibacteria group bacterium]MDD4695435.1 preprotein translocase subunit SecA [Patescibacteria group bacterium]
MFMGLLSKIIGDPNKKYLDSLNPIIEKINSLEDEIKKLSKEQLREKTLIFKEDLKKGNVTLEDILPEAFAMVREAAIRTLGQRHYDVQLIAGITLHKGRIAEMRTGEGKTLSSTLPLYLNALTGKAVHLVTVNDYLGKRDCVWMGQIYNYLGLTVSAIEHEASYIYNEGSKDSVSDDDGIKNIKVVEDYLKPVSRKEAYEADIVYGTNNEFGFDYLRDNMAISRDQISQRGFYYCIIDEVDSVLIDEARTPLIISSPDVQSTDQYAKFSQVVNGLIENQDYNIDEKMRSVTFTEDGQNHIAERLGRDPWSTADFDTIFHLESALKGELLFKKDKDYIVKDGEVIIVDEFTGRLMPGRRYSEGIHQAIEAKEHVKVQRESLTLATVTFQNYFRMYEKLSGMTGTAATEAEEFAKIYGLEVNIIPTNKEIKRKDLNDQIYKTEEQKFNAIVREIKQRHEKGQPVLVGTISIEKNEILGDLLKREGIPHNLLNAKQHEREAEIISQAGRAGAVTVATNMAGRGVDIILGGNPFNKEEYEKVKSYGGLLVLGTERHESRRIDNQLRGRSGRQGDPGFSQFYVSMDDDLMRIFGSDRIRSIMNTLKYPDDTPIEHKMISKSIEKAQMKVEGYNFDVRKHLVEYDDVINKQREIIYKKRKDILSLAEGEKIENYESLKDYIFEMIDSEISEVISFHTASLDGTVWNTKEIIETVKTIFPLKDEEVEKIKIFDSSKDKLSEAQIRTEIIDYISSLSRNRFEMLEERLNTALSGMGISDPVAELQKGVLLKTIDSFWIDHLDNISHLRAGIGLRGYAQNDPLVEYKRESYDLFVSLLNSIQNQVVYSIFKIGPAFDLINNPGKQNIILNNPTSNASRQFDVSDSPMAGEAQQSLEVKNKSVLKNDEVKKFGHKVGRNDDCPCGAKKEDGTPVKYKNCCGKNE